MGMTKRLAITFATIQKRNEPYNDLSFGFVYVSSIPIMYNSTKAIKSVLFFLFLYAIISTSSSYIFDVRTMSIKGLKEALQNKTKRHAEEDL